MKDEFGVPTFAYQVVRRIRDDQGRRRATAGSTATRAMMESLIAFKRAGADGVLTYFAPQVAEKLKAAGYSLVVPANAGDPLMAPAAVLLLTGGI